MLPTVYTMGNFAPSPATEQSEEVPRDNGDRWGGEIPSNVYNEILSANPLARNFWKKSRLNSCRSCLNQFLLTWNFPKAIKSKLKTLFSFLQVLNFLRNSTMLENVYALQVIFSTSSSKLWMPKLYLNLEILSYFLFSASTNHKTSSSG